MLSVVTGWDRSTGAALSGHRGVDKVAFTGSTATGIAVSGAVVAKVNRVILELGGKSAQTVFADADLDAAANGIVAGVFAATGQTCMAGSRLIVHESVADELVAKVVARLRAGTVWVNAYRMVAPNMPFGGFGRPGLGRENGIAAVEEYLETQSVYIELTGESRDPCTLG